MSGLVPLFLNNSNNLNYVSKKNCKKTYKVKTGKKTVKKTENTKNIEDYSSIKIDQGYVVGMKDGAKIKITGAFKLEVLYGHLNVFGAILKEGDAYTFISTSYYGIYTFCSKKKVSLYNKEEVTKILEHNHIDSTFLGGMKAATILRVISRTSIVNNIYLCFKIMKPCTNMISLEINPATFKNRKILKLSKFKNLTTKILKSPPSTILVCGLKKIGKSSYIRYLSNVLLTNNYNVYILDCDLNQPIFGPIGLVSLQSYSKYCFDPSWSTPETIKSYFIGDISPSFRAKIYINSIKKLYDHYKTYCIENENPNTYLLINTQGWIKDFGKGLLLDIVNVINPKIIIKLIGLRNENTYGNLDTDQDIDGIFTNLYNTNESIIGSITKSTNYTLAFKSSTDGSLKEKTQESDKINRYISLILYFSQSPSILPPMENSQNTFPFLIPHSFAIKSMYFILLSAITPNQFDMRSLKLNVVSLLHVEEPCEYKEITATGTNGTTLTIKTLPSTQLIECVSLGFIRNADLLNGFIFIVTPIEESLLERVNVICVGNISIPDEFIKNHYNSSEIGDSDHSNFHVRGHKKVKRKWGGRVE